MGSDITRKLATVRKISAIQPIPDADAIECAHVDGWPVVIKKNEFKVGDLVIYIEVDSWVPHDLAPFLSKGAIPREYNGVKGEKLKTIKLRGQVSQGLILNLPVFVEGYQFPEGTDLTQHLNIQKWEPPVSGNQAGQVKGTFPSWIRKTDQERIQNILREVFIDNNGEKFEATMKLDGSSCTIFVKDGEVGVCSRNQQLKINEENKDNVFVKIATQSGLVDILPQLNMNIAIQGEVMGPGVQGNREGFKDHKFFLFDIFRIDQFEYMSPSERRWFFNILLEKGALIDHVPILSNEGIIISRTNDDLQDQCNQWLQAIEGPSINHAVREGVVFKRFDGKFSFKVISNKYLLTKKE